MKVIRFTIVIAVLLFGFTDVSAQSRQEKKWETDVSMSPMVSVSTLLTDGKVVSAYGAIRYSFTPHFSMGLGIAPTYFDLITDELFYVPFQLSLRYSLTDDKKVSSYLVLDAGGSFLQVEPDPIFQARMAMGIDINLSEINSLFAELSLMYISEYIFWMPLSVGFRF